MNWDTTEEEMMEQRLTILTNVSNRCSICADKVKPDNADKWRIVRNLCGNECLICDGCYNNTSMIKGDLSPTRLLNLFRKIRRECFICHTSVSHDNRNHWHLYDVDEEYQFNTELICTDCYLTKLIGDPLD